MGKYESIPSGLEPLKHYIEVEKVSWQEAEVGSHVAMMAQDLESGQPETVVMRLIEKIPRDNGTFKSILELTENNYHFVDVDTDSRIILPAGTILQSGISCQHYPNSNMFMTYLGGIAAGRDHNFYNVLIPDGQIIDQVIVTRINNLLTSKLNDKFELPDGLESYKRRVIMYKEEEGAKYQKQVREMDQKIAIRFDELFDNEDTRQQIAELVSEFHADARWRLAVLADYATEDGVLDKYLDCLKEAIKKEWGDSPPGFRGAPGIPNTDRGFSLMIEKLGLRNPRPGHNTQN